MARIIIIGGGIAGLSAAYDACQDGKHQVTLIESSDRLGGKIITRYENDLVVEGGPDSVFTTKPWAVDLMVELGLESELEEPIGAGFSVLVGGKLHVVPRALASLMPSASTALESIGFLGATARKRILSEKAVEKGSGEDETIASFFRRRFGNRFSKTLAEPLLAGIHAGSADKLSMKALYPSYIGLEQKHGSLSAVSSAAPAIGAPSTSHRKPGFITLDGGLQRLVDVLVERLKSVDIRLNTLVEQIERNEDGSFRVHANEVLECDALIFAIPGYAAAPILSGIAPGAFEPLMGIRHGSTAVASFCYASSSFKNELHGNGFLVPADEPSSITGCTFSSLKWKHRAPDGSVLLRAFMGQDGGLNVDDYSDDQLLKMAVADFGKHLKVKAEPYYTRVDRWTKAMPQYEVGHTDRMDVIENAVGEMPILFAGCSYRGTGIPDCIRQGREAARSLNKRFA